MKRILLILSPARVSDSCVDEALKAAAQGQAELVTVFVLDTTISADFRSRLRDSGSLGEAPSDQLVAAMREEQERQGREELARVEELAAARGVSIRTRLVVGELVGCSLEAAQQESASAIFVTRRGRPAISRLVAGSAVRELADAAPCEVLVHDAGDARKGGDRKAAGRNGV
ncbi:MAG: universal stress protein [Candidatus Eisenbacteria bacterium]